jgi:hypothetical protein
MHFELWDLESRNLVDDFADERAAAAAVGQWVSSNPSAYPRELALARVDDDGSTVWLARDGELAQWAARVGSKVRA